MKNFKPTVEVSVGNPADEGDPYIIFFETGNKIAYRVRVKDAYFGADNDNNFVIQGKGYIANLNEFNIKTKTINTEADVDTEKANIKNINSKEINVNTEAFNITAKKFILDCEDILLRGQVKAGDITSVDEPTDKPDQTKEVYSYESVMTVEKFINFYEKKFIPFFKILTKLVSNFNTHTHGMAPVEPDKVIAGASGLTKITKSNLEDLQTSQTMKVL